MQKQTLILRREFSCNLVGFGTATVVSAEEGDSLRREDSSEREETSPVTQMTVVF